MSHHSRNTLLVLAVMSFLFANKFASASDEKIFLNSAVAQQNVRFNVSNAREAYSCGYVKAETMAILKAMGATKINVQCSGGLPYSTNYNVWARFEALYETTSDKSTIKAQLKDVNLVFEQFCSLRSTIITSVLPLFDVRDYAGDESCNTKSTGLFGFQLKTLF